jgi:hypothetical protein
VQNPAAKLLVEFVPYVVRWEVGRELLSRSEEGAEDFFRLSFGVFETFNECG